MNDERHDLPGRDVELDHAADVRWQIRTLIGLIVSGDLDEHLPEIARAVNQRQHERHNARERQVFATFQIGDRVRVNHSIRPSYLHGVTGTVVGFAHKNVRVLLDTPAGRFTDGEVTVPPLGLDSL
ncbi:hypothetical protein ACFXJ8_17985 [Nonomuraea sp. NPDC059194]|uniref:hypothetical protein n=1 Tax=Nonomuraea sp. NPDC059194 TaxID=3346764 RepID=UPI0036C2C611